MDRLFYAFNPVKSDQTTSFGDNGMTLTNV